MNYLLYSRNRLKKQYHRTSVLPRCRIPDFCTQYGIINRCKIKHNQWQITVIEVKTAFIMYEHTKSHGGIFTRFESVEATV